MNKEDEKTQVVHDLVIVNPDEKEIFGIKETQAVSLMTGLDIFIEERKPLIKQYKEIIDLEVTEENVHLFRELRLKVGKNRTAGTDQWVKDGKGVPLKMCQFYDSVKKRENGINKPMEERLLAKEKHFETLEKEKAEKLQKDRSAELFTHGIADEDMPEDLGSMKEGSYNLLLNGVKAGKKDKEEAARLDALVLTRQKEIVQYNEFIPQEFQADTLRSMSDLDYSEFIAKLVEIKALDDKQKKEKQRIEKAYTDRILEVTELKEFTTEKFQITDLKVMGENEYATFLNNLKEAKEAKEKEAEKLRLKNITLQDEAEKLKKLNIERNEELKDYRATMPTKYAAVSVGELSFKDWRNMLDECISAKETQDKIDAEQKAIQDKKDKEFTAIQNRIKAQEKEKEQEEANKEAEAEKLKKAGDKGVFDLFVSRLTDAKKELANAVFESEESKELSKTLADQTEKLISHTYKKIKS